MIKRSLAITTFYLLQASLPGSVPRAEELSSLTLSAFDQYAGQRERQIQEELSDISHFFWVDRLAGIQRERSYADMKKGGILIDPGKKTEIPDGLIHHWTGVGYIPGATLQQTLAFIQDYDHHASNYNPDVIASKLLLHKGNYYQIHLRFLKKKVIAVVLDTIHDVTFRSIDSRHVVSQAHTTRISEVKDHGKPNESQLPPGSGWGFLWKMNTYWRFAESDEGTYVQCETISLSRDVPFAVGWIVNRFVNSIPQESLTFTLTRTRERILELAAAKK